MKTYDEDAPRTFETLDEWGRKKVIRKEDKPMERRVFTYKDAKEARKWIGKRGIFNDNLKEISEVTGASAYLTGVNGSRQPFTMNHEFHYQFFSPDPEPVEKWVPFTKDEFPMLLGRGLIRKSDGCGSIVTTFGNSAIGTSDDRDPTPRELLEEYSFTDGTPCGKKVAE